MNSLSSFKTNKFKKGDKVKIVSLQSEGRGCCMDVVGDIGEIIEYDSSNIFKYKVKIEDGGCWWWEESNLELIEDVKPNTIKEETEMNATKAENTTPKFKKGDKVKVVGETSAMHVKLGGIYTIVNPCHHTGSFKGKKSNYVSLEGVGYGTPNEGHLELYIEPRNYRNMKPTDLIKVSIDGFEGEIPLGDLIHARALIANAKGTFGYNLYMFLGKLDEEDVVDYVYEAIEVFDKQEELMKDFFIIEADKANLKELISNKQNELKELQDKLNQLN